MWPEERSPLPLRRVEGWVRPLEELGWPGSAVCAVLSPDPAWGALGWRP